MSDREDGSDASPPTGPDSRTGDAEPAGDARPAGEDPPTGPDKALPPLYVVFSVTVSGILANTLVTPVVPDILDHFDQPRSAAGLVTAAAPVAGVVMAVVIGLLADRHGRRRVLVPCLVSFGLFGLASGLAPSFALLLLFRVGQGFGAAGLINLAVVLIGDYWSGIDRARLIGYNAAVLTVSIALFPAIGGGLAELGGWRLAFAPYVIPLVSAGLVWRRLPHDHDRPRPAGRLLDQLRRSGEVLRQPIIIQTIIYGFVLFVLIFGLFLTVLPILLSGGSFVSRALGTDTGFGLSAGQRGLVLAASAAASTLPAMRLGALRARFGAGTLVVTAAAFFTAGFALIGLAPTVWVVAIGATVYGMGEGMSIPTLQDLVTGAAPDEARGAVVAVWVSAVRMGQFAGAILAAVALSIWEPETIFLGAAVVPAVAFFGLLRTTLGRSRVPSTH